MKILAIGDLHGRKPVIKTEDFDCIVSVGDLCNDREIGKYYKKGFKLKQKSDEVLDINQMIVKDVGKKEFKRMVERSLKKGNKILRNLDKLGKPIFIVAGNWDESYGNSQVKDLYKSDYNYLKAFYDWYLGDKLNRDLIKGVKNIRNCMFKIQEFNGINFYGYGLSSGPEGKFNEKKDKNRLDLSQEERKKLSKAYKKIVDKLEKNYSKRDKNLPTFFITHNIPYKSGLDVVKQKDSYAHKKNVGSVVARNFINKNNPLFCIGGHVHEGKGKKKIKKTLIINPGYGSRAQVLLEIDEVQGNVKKVRFLG